MKKLIELLNEYEKDFAEKFWVVGQARTYHYDKEDECIRNQRGEEYNFDSLSNLKDLIKRLVDNDKIDEDKVPHHIYHSELVNDDYRDDVQQCIMTQWKKVVSSEFAEDEELLMLLAISDTPIEDLISYLK